MESGIHIEGPQITREAVESVADSIERVLAAAFLNHMDQDTTRHALDQLGRLGSVSGVAITDCTVSQGGGCR